MKYKYKILKYTIIQCLDYIMDALLNKYTDILEPCVKETPLDAIVNHPLYTNIEQSIDEYNNTNVLLSLSGGVDSMVMLELLCHIPSITVYCCHLNYNNRKESIIEMRFLKDYCELKNVHFDYIEFDFIRSETKRDVYEKETRRMRYKYYQELIDKYGCSCVLLAHHKDDIVENIYNNIMRGCREPNDLIVLKEFNTILDVNVCRPLLHVYKDVVYDVASKYNIPYFLDTTPDWSCRGKMRRKIFPMCDDCYGSQYKENIIQLGEDCETMGNIINTYIIDTVMKNDVIVEGKNFSIRVSDVLKEKVVMKIVLKKILHQMGLNIMKSKCIDQLINVLHSKKQQKMSLLKNYNTIVNENSIVFTSLLHNA